MRTNFNPEYSQNRIKFQFYVAYVDQNSTLKDEQQTPTLSKISPQTGRNLHIGGFRLNGKGGSIVLNVLVPQEVTGSFKMPQVGDVVWIEEDYRFPGNVPVYLYSAYNSVGSGEEYGYTPVPQWGSRQNDYGHLRSHRDHNRQFNSKINSNFVKKYVKSVTGYRFRTFYDSNLKDQKFAVRGDPVFDINPTLNDAEYVVEDGVDIGYGATIQKPNQHEYPNPLNVPKEREEDENYTYVAQVYKPIDTEVGLDPYQLTTDSSKTEIKKIKNVLKNKNFMSYQPILDKTYLNDVEFEREIPAAEEYQIALRGNNKLLIQDQHGDGEQLLITLKSQYDEQFTIVHNGEKGQIRLRDHLGQGVLLEADPEHPRVVSWTSANQKVEQGHVPDVGAYTYVRNGDQFGDSDTVYGTKTGLTKNDVSNQEFLLTSASGVVNEIQNKLSSGMYSLAASASAAGIFMRNNIDGDASDQTHAIYNTGSSLVYETNQEYTGLNGWVQSAYRNQTISGGVDVVDTYEIVHDAPGTPTKISETKRSADGDVSRNYLLDYNNTHTIVENESIISEVIDLQRITDFAGSGTVTETISIPFVDNVTKTSQVLLSDNTEILHSDIATPGSPDSFIETKVGGTSQNKVQLSSDDLKTERYVNGVLFSTLKQTDSSIDIERTVDGKDLTINVGNDDGEGAITIGHSAATLNLTGSTVNLGVTGGSNTIIGNTDFQP